MINDRDSVTLAKPTYSYGDPVWVDPFDLLCTYEQGIGTQGSTGNQDVLSADARLFFANTAALSALSALFFRIEGYLVTLTPYGGSTLQQRFRVISVNVVRDTLQKNKVHHVECALEKYTDATIAS